MIKDCIINEIATIKDALVAINRITGKGELLIIVMIIYRWSEPLQMVTFVEVLLLDMS